MGFLIFMLRQKSVLLYFNILFPNRNDSDGEGESEGPEKKKLQNQLQGNLNHPFLYTGITSVKQVPIFLPSNFYGLT